jgi:hypothetical protein
VQYRFRVSAPAAARVNAAINLPAYVHDAVPSCAATTGYATCELPATFPVISATGFSYPLTIFLNPNETADFALTARIGSWPFPDYWNEVFRVTGQASALDFNPLNNSVTVDTPLSLFRGSFETP